jgi:hypothetical protein
MMLSFIFFVIIPIILCIIIFGKTDDKKSLLNSVGLDYKKETYNDLKEKEFNKKVKKIIEDMEAGVLKENPNRTKLDLLYKMWQIVCSDDENYNVKSPEEKKVWWIVTSAYEKEKNNGNLIS